MTEKTSGLYYYGTKTEVQVGDLIEIRGFLWGKRRAQVSYIPGISEKDPDLENEDECEWTITYENGDVSSMGYYPSHLQPSKRIHFVSRSS
jgi:hypothetical protein